MTGLDVSNLLVILVVAFLVLGPDRMAQIARTLGRHAQRAQGEWLKFSQAFQEGLQEPDKAATLDEASEQAPVDDGTPAAGDQASAAASAEPSTSETEAAEKTKSAATPSKKKRGRRTPQSIPEHLIELRNRLVISAATIFVLTIIAYIFSDTILYILRAPAPDLKLRAFNPMDGFLVRIRIALYGGLFLSAPVWIYQLMMFILPGLLPQERRILVPTVIAMVLLFLLGNLFGYLLLQNMFFFILNMFGSELEYFPSAYPFISFVIFFLVATGIAFELPLVLIILVRVGLVSVDTLRKQRKISYFIIFVFAELIWVGADPFIGPLLVMLPMLVLFELAILVARFITPKPASVAAPQAATRAES